MHARIVKGAVAEWPIGDLRKRLPDMSLPVDLRDNDRLPDGFVFVRFVEAPRHDENTHKLVEFGPVKQDGEWVYGYTAKPLNKTELKQAAERAAINARATRNRLLADCDWTQLPDAVVDKQAWSKYREALRGISKQKGFPLSIEWPTMPT